MKHLYSLSILILLILCFLFSSTTEGQTSFRTLILVNTGEMTDTLFWGLDPLATNGIDPDLGEYEQPPPGVSEVFDVRFANPPGWNLFGEGLKHDYRAALGGAQKDTFVISIQSQTETVEFNWPTGLSDVCGTLRLINHPSHPYDPEDPLFPLINVNMLTQTSFTLTGYAADGGYKMLMIRNELSEDTSKYRSFTHAELVTEDAVKLGKVQKYIKRKADKVEFEFQLTVPAHTPEEFTTLHFEYGAAPFDTTFIKLPGQYFPPQIVKKNDVELVLGVDYRLEGTIDTKNKKFNYVFSSLTAGDVINIHGYVKASKPIKAKYWWLPVDVANKEKIVKLALTPEDPAWTLNQPRLPMPNYCNVVADIFPAYNKVTMEGGMIIGDNTGDPKVYGWLKMYSYKDLQKTLRGKTDVHTGDPRHFDFFQNTTKPVIKENKALPPEKHNNKLMANLVALRFNIYASAYNHTPSGFGKLEYYEPGNDLDGMSLLEISALGNEKMTHQDSLFDYVNLNTVVEAVNNAFSGKIDTVRFWDKLVLTPVGPLSEVPYLKQGSGESGGNIISYPPSAPMVMPDEFVLYQNYPNPFNPTTTIEFNLPEDAMVTLKVYNMLGQEVATLIDKEELYEGWESVTFDATGLSSGVYIYRVIAVGTETGETFQMIKKMVLMK